MQQKTTTRGGRVVVALLALAAVGLLTLGPRAVVAPARNVFTEIADALISPVAAVIPYGDDRALNAILFVPLGAALAMLLARRLWPVAILTGFGISAAVEFAQGMIPGRVPDPHDVLWNTLGAAAGALVVAVIRGAVAASVRYAGRTTRT